jgi:hypothetical protein
MLRCLLDFVRPPSSIDPQNSQNLQSFDQGCPFCIRSAVVLRQDEPPIVGFAPNEDKKSPFTSPVKEDMIADLKQGSAMFADNRRIQNRSP